MTKSEKCTISLQSGNAFLILPILSHYSSGSSPLPNKKAKFKNFSCKFEFCSSIENNKKLMFTLDACGIKGVHRLGFAGNEVPPSYRLG